MSNDRVFWLFGVAFGALLAIHCPRAAFREFKSGKAEGRRGTYHRASQPVEFWLTIAGTALAGLMGLFFVVFGIAAIAFGAAQA